MTMPAPSYENYAKALSLSLAALVRRTLSWRVRVTAAFLLAITLGFWTLYYGGFTGGLYLASEKLDWEHDFPLSWVVLSYEAFAVLIMLLMRAYYRAYSRRLSHLLFEERYSGASYGAVLWGEEGLLIVGEHNLQRIPWAWVYDFVLSKGTWFLRTRGSGVLPIPADAFDQLPDGTNLIAFIKDRIAQKRLAPTA
jgi:hypothetical protein